MERSCVSPSGRFIVGVHTPHFSVKNFRPGACVEPLGRLENGEVVENTANFPAADLQEPGADTIYEVANALGFRGTTYINSAWADTKARNPETIKIKGPADCSWLKNVEAAGQTHGLSASDKKGLLDLLPRPLRITLAEASTDPEELVLLARMACRLEPREPESLPNGMGYIKTAGGRVVPDIFDHELFEVLVNNPCLPDAYKNAMVLRPGVQGSNEITGEYLGDNGRTHVFEYLRRNSYIPWGHFAANMANDSIRYKVSELSTEDMTGLRHLYYQRAYARVAQALDIPLPGERKTLTPDKLESVRKQIMDRIQGDSETPLEFNATLWGWNFGFGYAASSSHRLHASHQMIHQQNAMIPDLIPTTEGGQVPAFSCGDLVADFIRRFQAENNRAFFDCYLSAICQNTRTDGNPEGPTSLIISENEDVILFVPKAQVCEFELQLIPKKACGNIFMADTRMRKAIDKGILTAVRTLDKLGARLITSIEFSSRLNRMANGQHLIYSFIPRLPYASPTFSEAQHRWISGLYPEDLAAACRKILSTD